ncbi:MAG: TerC family protein [Sporomusaceae bacterium]|jgi:YjbE family integral membrane protein|nr:TerC family protein [Sporomusaceae bacterium]
MDLGMLAAFGSVLLIDLVLSGDNAIIIALACRNLPHQQQKQAIFWGTFGAIFGRVALVIIATYLLQIPYLMCIGGLALIYIAIKLLTPSQSDKKKNLKQAGSLAEAVKIILLADVIMSLDNVLALAGVAGGDFLILVVGLALSVPIIVWGSTFLMKLMEKYPLIIYAGAGVLGWTSGKMIVSDASLSDSLAPYALLFEIGLTVLVLAVGHFLKKGQTFPSKRQLK